MATSSAVLDDWRNCRVNSGRRRRSFEAVAKSLRCVCGAVLSGDSDAELFRRVEEHIEKEHQPARTGLTQAEAKVASLVGEGLSNRQVGDRLGLGVKTVETHLSHVFRKLGIRSRDELKPELREKSPNG
jgi:DNA-binding CsgD family transcriptional regulator